MIPSSIMLKCSLEAWHYIPVHVMNRSAVLVYLMRNLHRELCIVTWIVKYEFKKVFSIDMTGHFGKPQLCP